MRPGDGVAAEAGMDLLAVKSNRSSDYEGIDICDRFAHNFVYESNFKHRREIKKKKAVK